MNRRHFIKHPVAGTAILAISGLVYKASSYSTTRKFYSEGEGVSNHLPYAATLIGPTLNSKLNANTANLEWSSSDIDNDLLSYDIYFSEVSDPSMVLENSSSTNYEISIDANTTYYWKIVLKDDAGGEVAEGFTTEELRDMLSKSVMLDVFALDILWERGLGDLTGVKPRGDVPVAVTERFTDHPMNSPDAGFVREAYAKPVDRPGTLVPVSEGVQDLSHLIRHDGSDLGSCLTLYENKLGERVAVSSYSPWSTITLVGY